MYEDLFNQMVEHYAKLASNPGFYDYARQRVAQMMKEEPELWGKLGSVPGTQVIVNSPAPLPGGSDYQVEMVISSMN
mgnify:CR=1 FL=1